jgi:hypothetical protein
LRFAGDHTSTCSINGASTSGLNTTPASCLGESHKVTQRFNVDHDAKKVLLNTGNGI